MYIWVNVHAYDFWQSDGESVFVFELSFVVDELVSYRFFISYILLGSDLF